MDELTMKNTLLHSIALKEGADFNYDATAILNEYKLHQENATNSTIKILTIFGGFLASLAFLGFLALAGLYDSKIGLLVVGSVFIIAAIWSNTIYNKLIIDTFSISIYVIGYVVLAIGLDRFQIDENFITLLICCIACCTLIITQGYIISFISTLIVNGSILSLIISNDMYFFIHIYIIFNTLLISYLFLNEANIISVHKKLSKLYDPLRIGILISLLFGLIAIGKKDLLPIQQIDGWLTSIILITVILYLTFRITKIIEIASNKKKFVIYILSFLLLLLTLFSPSISGALIILLLSFLVNYKTGLVIGIVSFIYFISQFYYDLNFTLLTKSIILFSTGMVFLLFYVLITTYLKAHEKI